MADGAVAGTATVSRTLRATLDAEGVPTVTGAGGQLLLWLYDRHGDPGGEADVGDVDPVLLQRFRGLCFTD